MHSLFQKLPGETVALKDVPNTLKEMWNMNQEGGKLLSQRPDFRAMQMNLILHFGTKLKVEDAVASFSQALDFSCLHPCRILVLCPCPKENESLLLEAKLFSQCYIGRGTKNMSCCDAIILNYSENENHLLEHQVSIWLDNDLPTYHWLRGVEASKIGKEYFNCLTNSNKILYDSAAEGIHYQDLKWPEGVKVEDFCYLRTLPLCQALGSHLSNYKPALITEGLKAVDLQFHPSFEGEGAYLLQWIGSALQACQSLDQPQAITYSQKAKSDSPGLDLQFIYEREASFHFSYDLRSGQSRIENRLEATLSSHPLQIYKLSPEDILSQAIFD